MLGDVDEALELGRWRAHARLRWLPPKSGVRPLLAAKFAGDLAGLGVETRLAHARFLLTPVSGMQA